MVHFVLNIKKMGQASVVRLIDGRFDLTLEGTELVLSADNPKNTNILCSLHFYWWIQGIARDARPCVQFLSFSYSFGWKFDQLLG